MYFASGWVCTLVVVSVWHCVFPRMAKWPREDCERVKSEREGRVCVMQCNPHSGLTANRMQFMVPSRNRWGNAFRLIYRQEATKMGNLKSNSRQKVCSRFVLMRTGWEFSNEARQMFERSKHCFKLWLHIKIVGNCSYHCKINANKIKLHNFRSICTTQ